MRLLLIHPRSHFLPNTDVVNDAHLHALLEQYYSIKEHSSIMVPALGTALPVIASLTPDIFDDIRIINGEVENIPFDSNVDLVGISMMTVQADEGYRISEEFRKRKIYTVVGGTHPTLMPQEAQEHADTVIAGEAEGTWPEFIKHFIEGRPRRFYCQKKAYNLRLSPLPRYDLLPRVNSDAFAFLQTSRGCPNGCDYCSVSKVYGPHFRYKGPEQIKNEILRIKSLDPFSKVFFTDDNMFVDRDRAKKLLSLIAPLNIRWATQSDIGIEQDKELLDLIAASGCEYLFIGLESISQFGIQYLSKWKSNYFHRYHESIGKIQSSGIPICGAFIVGTDDQQESIFSEIKQFIATSSIYKFHLSILTPFPGTSIRSRLHKEKRLLNKAWSNYDLIGLNFVPKNINPKRLQYALFETLISA